MCGLTRLITSVRVTGSPFGCFLDGFLRTDLPSVRHCGDLLPIPSVCAALVSSCILDVGDSAEPQATVVNFTLAGTNFLFGGMQRHA